MNKIKISDRCIGEEEPCFIIAEAGVNHNGSLSKALKLVDVAHNAGACAIKFQTWSVNELYIPDSISGKNYRKESRKRCLSYDDFREIKKYCDAKKIIFLSTPDEEKSADFLESLDVPAFKVGSSELNNHPFLIHLAKKKKPLIISVGMSNIEDINETVNLIKRYNTDIILLQCTSSYPTPIEEVNLKVIPELKKRFGCITGLSDHSESYIIPSIAVAIGAKVIEKHFTVNKKWSGPDNKMSLNPFEFIKMVDLIRITENALGDGIKKLKEVEMPTQNFAKKCIVAAYELSKNTILEEKMLAFKRPYLGLEPNKVKDIIGMKLKRDIQKDNPIRYSDLK